MNLSNPIRQRLDRIQAIAPIAAVLGLFLAVIGAFLDIDHFFRVYLMGYLFWLELALGCLGFLLLSNLVRGKWLLSLQRIAAAGARTLPLLAVLFIPILIGLNRIYPWPNFTPHTPPTPEEVYFNGTFFVFRAVIYFGVWSALAYLITNWMYKADRDNDPELYRKVQRYSAGGMVLLFLTVTFSTTDWVLALNDHWYSSVYGWLAMSRQALMFMSLTVGALYLFADAKDLKAFLTERVRVDLGVVMLATLMMWLYLNYVQYFIMWAGDIPQEVEWYLVRFANNWSAFLYLGIAVHVAALFLLLTPGLKRRFQIVAGIAAVLLVMRFAEYYWLIFPMAEDTVAIRWWDSSIPLALGGVWVALFSGMLKRETILPVNQPPLEDIVEEAEERPQNIGEPSAN